eukprot:5241678-Ditylum_brightwellii.AAC.1
MMISGLTDFVEEKTRLQHMGEAAGWNLGMSITIDRSPKGHPEVAGEGIKYTWVCAKFYMRTVPVGKRKTAAQFWREVRLSLSTTGGATLNYNKICKFAARARNYISTYHLLHNTSANHSKVTTPLQMTGIKKMKKSCCSHCRVERCDMKWCVDAASVILKKSSSERN